MMAKMTEKRSKILPSNSLNAQFVPNFQNVASDLNKTRNHLLAKILAIWLLIAATLPLPQITDNGDYPLAIR
jgi:hypothetical protein